ncbi:DUF2170 family protein [Teredinibacter turnerae]|uniref:Cytoplasmic protein n=1 Tax=Teredinibacter turnerae (strain ATCC 39867 / T7901) TaxID=377629 RepID=C5BI44_TERTT|nr:DUF2170 family protein [Teredinibacter turnerae]ACR11097.1 conserved hypothetical protein [Teredinibacter turnerae T7901]
MVWNTNSLQALLEQHGIWEVSLESGCITVTNDEGIDAFIYAGDRQLLVEVPLFPEADVIDVAALNDKILETHYLAPLSCIYKKSIGGQSYYIAFGALSLESKDHVVIEEVSTLFENVDEFLDLYADNLKKEVA